jgi:hypothetical protein
LRKDEKVLSDGMIEKELSQGREWYEEEFNSHFSVGKKLQDFSLVNLKVRLQKE